MNKRYDSGSIKTKFPIYTILFLLFLVILAVVFSLAARYHGITDDAEQYIIGLEKRGYHGP